MVEADYAGYQIKVDAERKEAYDRFKALLRIDASGAGVDRCQEVIATYLAFFQDHHLFVLGDSKAAGPGRKTARPWTEAEARAEIDRYRERLDPVEGLWYSREGRYAVLQETGAPAGTFFAVRLAGDGTPSSDLTAVLRRIGHSHYRVTSRDIDYQQAILNAVGCGDHAYNLGVPLYTRTRDLPVGTLDVVGITPDIPVPDHLADPLAFAVRLLALP